MTGWDDAPANATIVTATLTRDTGWRAGLAPWRGRTIRDVVLFVVFLILVLWTVAPGQFTHADPLRGVSSQKLLPPSWAHPFGTDYLGRDLFSRVVHGTSLTLLAAAIAVPVGLVFGGLLGLLAAGLRRFVDTAIMRLIDVLLAVPGFLMALTLVTTLGPGITTLGLAIGISAIAPFARLMRSEVMTIREMPYVEAAWLSGHGRLYILFREILPNALGPVLALVAVEISHAILIISALSFLGYGNPPPSPEWGVLIAEGRKYLATAWWITTFPGVTLIATVLAFAALSRRLQAAGRL
jgi:peptide/nickel transport system permease protein